MTMLKNNAVASSSSSSANYRNVDLDADSQFIDLTKENFKTPTTTTKQSTAATRRPTATINLKRGGGGSGSQQQQRKLPIQVAAKKMMLPYENATKPTTFFGYKMFYLSRAQHVIFKAPVKIFQCNNTISTTDIRIGVADIEEDDRMSLIKVLNNVAGSLPITVKNVRRPIEEEEDVLFISLKRNRASVFDHRGVLMAVDKLPKVCEAKFAMQISMMKVKDDESSFIISVEQIMLKKASFGKPMPQTVPQLLFDVSSESEEEEMVVE